MHILVTGANGFVGQNMIAHLKLRNDVVVQTFTRQNSQEDLDNLVSNVDVIVHLAGVNRPENPAEFQTGNSDLTLALLEAIRRARTRNCPNLRIIYASSIQVEQDNPYGQSKRAAEDSLIEFSQSTGAQVNIFRLPNVFGKWSRPNYNSAIATFCYNVAYGLPIVVNNEASPLWLVYIDDVIQCFLATIDGTQKSAQFMDVQPTYRTTVGEVASMIQSFRDCRSTLEIGPVGIGLNRALYSTYVSHLPKSDFSYPVVQHSDPRGVFVEMLKTKESGQFSYFTAPPDVTRGEHYHHSKTEKFLVIRGKARFGFRNILTDEKYSLEVCGEDAQIVETVPGWTHDITNIGTDEMIVMLWANEIFDREKPDTYAMKV